MLREPCVAGRFYESDPARLNASVDQYLAQGGGRSESPTLLAMVPHAGYVYSGGVCGKTLAQANLASTVLLLGPNHTGFGTRFSLWPEGSWAIPGAEIPVDEELASAILEADSTIAANTMAHVREHSLEVVLPFLARLDPSTSIVPLSVSSNLFEELKRVGQAIGKVLKAFSRPVSIVVSSDMSHYISSDDARQLDSMALDAAVALDPARLFETVRVNEITMCGVRPMTVGLFAALELGATHGELAAYANSGDVTGDNEQVVGYAGVLVR
ncbi:AmmeMemoRadiSam system protein B [Pseudodesulfovibrio sp.]|uniref:AmmeMemoRadiSam system protein B n=1 Tax=unclassified Pseudodesulfovibrio TaxID=2661612 RepID=UPI003AFF73FC